MFCGSKTDLTKLGECHTAYKLPEPSRSETKAKAETGTTHKPSCAKPHVCLPISATKTEIRGLDVTRAVKLSTASSAE